jgi:hypothetical protein
MKEWWNNFKQDLLFNIVMTFMVSILMLLFILLSILCIKVLITQIF